MDRADSGSGAKLGESGPKQTDAQIHGGLADKLVQQRGYFGVMETLGIPE
jgi:hypothetical protein